MVWWLVAAATSDDAWAEVQAAVGSPVGLVVLFGWTVSLMYHFFAGIRHLAWGTMATASTSRTFTTRGYAVLIATAVSSVALWAVGPGHEGLSMSETAKRTATKDAHVAVMRSQLGRGRAGSARPNPGVGGWQAMHWTSIALVPLTLWFVWNVVRLLGAPRQAVLGLDVRPGQRRSDAVSGRDHILITWRWVCSRSSKTTSTTRACRLPVLLAMRGAAGPSRADGHRVACCGWGL